MFRDITMKEDITIILEYVLKEAKEILEDLDVLEKMEILGI